MTKDKLEKLLEKNNLTEAELNGFLKQIKKPNANIYKPMRIDGRTKRVRFGALTDMHIGHICYRPDILEHARENFKKKKVDFVINGGDTIEGMSGREGHIYELTHIGYSEQMKYFEQEFQKLDLWDVFSIEAQDSHSGWFHNKANMGVNIGEELSKRVKNYKFIGFDEQDLIIGNNLKVRLRHPGGGTAYAISYKMQKYVESISGGDKPNMIFQGHFHKANYIFYRNIHAIDGGALQSQSPFLKKKGSPSHLCYWIFDVRYNKKGITEFTPTMFPFYEK